MKRYRLDLHYLDSREDTRHPQLVIEAYAVNPRNLQPESLGDCWLFEADGLQNPPIGYFVDITDAQRPLYMVPVEPVRIEVVGQGVSWSEITVTLDGVIDCVSIEAPPRRE
jgi:hypothetical protein